MNVNYTVKKMTLRDSSKEHIEIKMKKLDKFFSEEASAKITLRLEGDRVTAELTVKDGSMIYRAEDVDKDLTNAFDDAYDSLIRRIRKQKTKLEKRLRSTAFEPVADEAPLVEEGEFKVIRTKQFELKPLSVQEAILQMNLLGHQFYMFLNNETELINVVYLRNDGEYGLIEPR